MTQNEKREYIKNIWLDPRHPGGLAGPLKVYQIVKKEGKYKIGLNTVKKILSNIEAYSVQKPARRHFSRSRVIVSGIDAQWDGDLASMENVAKYNDGVQFLLVLIDIFSRFLIVKPLTNKKSVTVANALKSIFQHNSRKPKVIRFDQGGEFKAEVKKYLKKEDIHVFYTLNKQTKANYAERVIRTLKERIYSYFMEKQTYRYIDVLQDIVHSYNNTPHQSLDGITPASVTKRNEDEIRYMQYLVRKKRKQPPSTKLKRKIYKFKIGDLVRISHLKGTFQKGYQEKWTVEYFKVANRFKRGNQDIYKLIDMLGDEIHGTFYRYELQKVMKSDTDTYKVEKIIKRRKWKGRKQVLVKWLGWPAKFNSWVDDTDIRVI